MKAICRIFEFDREKKIFLNEVLKLETHKANNALVSSDKLWSQPAKKGIWQKRRQVTGCGKKHQEVTNKGEGVVGVNGLAYKPKT